jgi:hypothetical protein
MRSSLGVACVVLLVGCAGGPSDDVAETVGNVLALRTGTVLELRGRRGTGPFRDYDLPPRELLAVVEEAAGRARDRRGAPVRAIAVSERYGEVVAKEPPPEDSGDDSYSVPFLSAMVATVHPVPGSLARSRLEVHATHRGPFDRGVVDWERDLPRWIDETLRDRRARVAPIPAGPLPPVPFTSPEGSRSR